MILDDTRRRGSRELSPHTLARAKLEALCLIDIVLNEIDRMISHDSYDRGKSPWTRINSMKRRANSVGIFVTPR